MKKRAIIVEIFIWTIIFTLLFLTIIFTYSKFFIEPNIYNIQFKDIDGITKGSPVRFMGINIGYVRDLKAKDKYINVQILVTKKDMKIPNGTMARVEFYGLGGSKSIELMPSYDSVASGIVTEHTIRIADVVNEANSIVEIIELVDRLLRQLNSTKLQDGMAQLKTVNSGKIINVGKEMSESEKNITLKINKAKRKQKEAIEAIQNANETFLKLNKFIKK